MALVHSSSTTHHSIGYDDSLSQADGSDRAAALAGDVGTENRISATVTSRSVNS